MEKKEARACMKNKFEHGEKKEKKRHDERKRGRKKLFLFT